MHWLVMGALVIGLSLGALGSGGSILTVPILTYLLGLPEKTAIVSSLAVVGGISLIGALPSLGRGQIDTRALLGFGLPGMAGTAAGAWLSQWLPAATQMVLFAVLALVAAWRMAGERKSRRMQAMPTAWLSIVAAGSGVGLLTGLVGIGGGFMIVPALVLLLGLPMQRAVPTSLLLIVLNSCAGLARHAWGPAAPALDGGLIAVFIAVGGVASLLGNRLSHHLPQRLLRRTFAIVLVLVALSILGSYILSLS